MSACDDPASPSCQSCCRTATHETDWGCQATDGSPTMASCCTGDWDATCWNVASAANNGHACNQCEGKLKLCVQKLAQLRIVAIRRSDVDTE